MKNITRGILLATTGSMLSLAACEDRADTNSTVRDGTERSTAPATTPTGTNSAYPAPTVGGAQTPAGSSTNLRDPDNTRNNRGDGSSNVITPENQSESSEHIRTTADIRRAVMNDESLSSNAKNCKIITDSSGRVTLRGIVESQAELSAIGAHAQRIAGDANVSNQLEINTN